MKLQSRSFLLCLCSFLVVAGCPASASHGQAGEAADAEKAKKADWKEALTRARVWKEPEVPVSAANLAANPAGPDSWPVSAEVECKLRPGEATGATQKFECALPDGAVVKVKYGKQNKEVYTEVAATRLLAALGFGADRMYVVRRVRCHGCPPDPFDAMKHEKDTSFDFSRYTDFATVAIERRLPGETLGEGWAWTELGGIDPAKGGSSRAEVDALRLMAVLIDNWDNKKDNQRLLCLPGATSGGAPCARPFAYMHDVGGTFGRPKLDLEAWRKAKMWKDAKTCVTDVRDVWLHKTTFETVRISEAGRLFLVKLLRALSEPQIESLFKAARFPEFPYDDPAANTLAGWVQAFQDKVREIEGAGPCPSSAP